MRLSKKGRSKEEEKEAMVYIRVKKGRSKEEEKEVVVYNRVKKGRSKDEKEAVVFNIPTENQKRRMTQLGKRSWALQKPQNVLKTFKSLGGFLLGSFSRRAAQNLNSFLESGLIL